MHSLPETRALLTLLLSLVFVVLSAACKKGSPTSPESPTNPNAPNSPNPPPLAPPPSPQFCPPPSQTTSPSSGALTFKGVISSGSQGLSHICVYLSWDASQNIGTDAKGEFAFSGFSGSHFIITPSLRGHAFSPSNYELGRQSREDLNFTAQPPSYGSTTGQSAPDMGGKNQIGEETTLYDYFGQVVLINISADWCGSCREEAGHLEKLFQDYRDKGFYIIMLLTEGDPAAWASECNLTFPVLDDSSGGASGIYLEGWLPVNIILDRNMTIRYKEIDYDESAIIDTIKKYL